MPNLFGIPTIVLTLPDAQAIGAAGQPAISAVITQGRPDDPEGGDREDRPDELDRLQAALERSLEIDDDGRGVELLEAGRRRLGLIVYLSSLERARDVAVLKATGATGSFVATGLVIQGVAVTLVAAVAAAGLANLLAPSFPMTLDLTLGVYARLMLLAVVVGLLASLVGVRRALTIDAALAFG